MYCVWRVVCGAVRFAVCVMWCAACGMWYIGHVMLCVVCCGWYVVCGMSYVVCGMWYVVCGLQNMTEALKVLYAIHYMI